ncbi:hypothetical protein AN1V17_20580 [Vallitalea sediminicola]
MLDTLKRFWNEEDGMGVVEIALIIIVIVGIVVIFRKKIIELINDLFAKISGETDKIPGVN